MVGISDCDNVVPLGFVRIDFPSMSPCSPGMKRHCTVSRSRRATYVISLYKGEKTSVGCHPMKRYPSLGCIFGTMSCFKTSPLFMLIISLPSIWPYSPHSNLITICSSGCFCVSLFSAFSYCAIKVIFPVTS